METSNFRRLLRRTIAVPLVLLGLLAIALVVEVVSLVSSLRSVDHSDQVMDNSRQAMRRMVEMESSLRGYELTHDKAFLNSFEQAKSGLPNSIDSLVQLTADNKLQQDRLKDIRDLDNGWVQWAEQQIALQSSRRPTEDDLLFGVRLMDEIRTRQREIVSEEERLLHERSRQARILGRVALITAIGLTFLVALLLLTLTRRELRALTGTYEHHLQQEAERGRQLQESREFFRITLNSLAEGVVATDASGYITFSNPAAQKLIGLDLNREAQNRRLGEALRIIDEGTRVELQDPMDLLLEPERMASVTHLAMINAKGHEFPVEVNAAPILSERHEMTGAVMVFRDITQRRQTEQALRVSERLTQAGRLSATIAHEIRNPLDTVTNLIYLLQHDSNPASVSQQYLEMAGEELSRITQITGQLLTFHREARHPVQVSIAEVLDSVLTLFAPQIRKSGVTVEKLFETPARVRGFPGELRQVFSNLVGNAIDAMPHGGRLILHVRESARTDDPSRKGIRTTIIDTGSGISSGVKRNLFAPFYTTKGEKGTGLGLWVSRGIVDKHEGTIHVISTTRDKRSGTAFSVFLPYEQVLGKLDVPRMSPATTA
jgi:PAS domain S-box-containing protein